jgi:glycosyltransferase involved in cell wall biosynthesis
MVILKPIKILYVVRTVTGGVASVVEHMITSLDRKRFEPIVLFDTDRQSSFLRRMEVSGIKTVTLCSGTFFSLQHGEPQQKNRNIGRNIEANLGKKVSEYYFSLKAFKMFITRDFQKIKSIVRLIRDYEIDIVHTHNSFIHSKPEVIASRITGVKCISHRHGYSTYCRFDRFFDLFVHRYVYISEDVARHHRSCGESPSKGIVIHNGIDIKPYSTTFNYLVKQNEFACDPEDTAVGLIGRIDWWKGHDDFVKAISEAAAHHPNLKAVIIGSVDDDIYRSRNMQYLQSVKALISNCNLDEKVLFMGHREDVPRLISGLDIVVLASSTPEPFGLVVIEGMASSKPVIATAAGGVLDIISDGINGLLVPCKDHKAMAGAILKLISEPETAKKLGASARADIVNKFTAQHQINAIQSLYGSISKNR